MRSVFPRMVPGLVVLAAALAFSLWAYPQLPDQVATHFNLRGEADGWSSRQFATLLMPVMMVVMTVVFLVLPKIDPRRANYELFGGTYWMIVNAVLVLMAAIHVVSLGKGLGWAVNIARMASLGVGALFILLGNQMTRIRPNWFMGIRTPWTLSSDTVWRKTHRFGGIAFVVSGLCIAATALVTARWAMMGAIGVAVAASLGSVVYSYVVWRQEQRVVERKDGTAFGGE